MKILLTLVLLSIVRLGHLRLLFLVLLQLLVVARVVPLCLTIASLPLSVATVLPLVAFAVLHATLVFATTLRLTAIAIKP